jgi:hypothetical protein
MAPEHQNKYWVIGFKIGSAPDPLDTDRIIHLPTSFDFLVDDVVIKKVRNEIWYGVNDVDHVIMLDKPVEVGLSIGLHINSRDVGFSSYVSLDKWEPIFGLESFRSDVPFIGEFKAIPYLNGHALIEGIDYNIISIKDPAVTDGSAHVTGTELVITNALYLKESDNNLEVIITRNRTIGEYAGYLTSDIITPYGSNPFWFDNLSILTIDGHHAMNTSTKFGQVSVDMDDYRDGAVCNTRTHVPKTAQLTLDKYGDATQDEERMLQLVRYFGEPNPTGPPILLMTHSHRIVSIFLATVIHAQLNGDIDLIYDPDPAAIEAQLFAYAHIKEHDLVFTEDSVIELAYIDVQTTYVETIVESTLLYRTIKSLTDYLLKDVVDHRRYDHEPPVS